MLGSVHLWTKEEQETTIDLRGSLSDHRLVVIATVNNYQLSKDSIIKVK